MDNESLWQICSFPRAVAEKGELGGRFEPGQGGGGCAGGAAVLELRLCGAWSSLGIATELPPAESSSQGCSIPGWAGLLGAADSSFSFLPPLTVRQRLLLVLFQRFLLELFEVFWDVCSCKLIDRLGYQMRKQILSFC